MATKLRAYNSKILADYYSMVVQMQLRLEQLVKHSATPITMDQLPDSLVPTETLYNLLVCYDVMYNALYDDGLIKDGHIKTQQTIH
jgi:shikimate 5-dehydrogenase